MLPTPFTVTTDKRQNRSLIQDVTPFLKTLSFSTLTHFHLKQNPIYYILFHYYENIVILTYIKSTMKHLTLHHHKSLFKLFLTLLKE